MPVILRTGRTGVPSYVRGNNGDAVGFTEDASQALVFVDAAAASAFAVGKNIHGAVQVTTGGITNPGTKTCT